MNSKINYLTYNPNIMWPFDIFKKKKEKKEQEQRRLHEEERRQKLENERLAKERDKRLEENRQKEAERQARIRAEKEKSSTMEPFTFKSNCYQRFENGTPVMGLQECGRTISVVKNTNGCQGYQFDPGDGYIVKFFNDDIEQPYMSDKPMRVVRKTETSVELRGFPILARSPFGWQEVDNADYGLMVHYEAGKVSKCVLHMYDRKTFIEYRIQNKKALKNADVTGGITECESYAKMSRDAASNGNTSMAHQYGKKALDSIINNKSQVKKIKDVKSIALSLGKLMEGDYFRENEEIIRAVGISYYFLCKAIIENKEKDPYLYVYRFSIVWEYNKAFYRLFAHADGKEYSSSPYDIMGHIQTQTYDHHMQGMQMADGLTEPRIRRIDPAVGNIFAQIHNQYYTTPDEKIINIGNKYHQKVYEYLKKKVELDDYKF